ncbi:hypothetical protein ABRT01_03055 [Lentibacillus sp. L22]|uniref:hypothetical protein n=1 Tax=Lentibacillus sp. L22 TaxID=3163028 RepID=UPI003466B42D
MKKKKWITIIVVLAILIASPFAYISYKKKDLETDVINYLTTEKKLRKAILFLAYHLLQIWKGIKILWSV